MTPLHRRARLLVLSAACLLSAGRVSAQELRATLAVHVQDSTGAPLAEASVRSGRSGAFTDAQGMAELRVAPGRVVVVATRIGYQPDSTALTVAAGQHAAVTLTLRPASLEIEEITVTATRGQRRLDDEPVRVEVLGGEDVSEKTAMRPGDLTKLLSEMPGVRLQAGGGGLGASRFRIQGLRGQYTGLVSDGLPLFGPQTGGFGLVQLAPLDMKQAEVIKGASTALYGPSALGGVLNLVSKRPDDASPELVLDQSAQAGTHALFWGGHRLSATSGATLYADAHNQALRDVNGDGWSDFAGYTRTTVRPRFFLDLPNGDGLYATAGASIEDRTGGFVSPSAYRETLDTRRFDAGIVARRTLGHNSKLIVRASGLRLSADRTFGGQPDRTSRTSAFTEITASGVERGVDWVVGGAFLLDDLDVLDNPGVGHAHRTPAVFGQLTVPITPWLITSASGRCDFQNVYGTYCSPRLSALLKADEGPSLRLSAASGFFAPTAEVEETDAIGLRNIVPTTLVAERAKTASADLSWRTGPWQLNATFAFSHLDDPVRLVAAAVPGKVQLVNAAGPTDTYTTELFAVYDAKPLVITFLYAWLQSTEEAPAGGRRPVALQPTHTGGIDATWENSKTGTWVALEGFYTGTQSLYEDPARTSSPDYVIVELLAMQKVGRTHFYLNVNNLFDVRITNSEPLLLATPGLGGRRTILPWGPIEGRVVAVGARIGF